MTGHDLDLDAIKRIPHPVAKMLVADVESLRAELAAERAKVERVAVIRAEWGERKADEPCHELYVALGRALAGGEKE